MALWRFRFFVYWGLARVVNGYLNRRALNNGTVDKYDWQNGSEVVVVTGGADGIGKRVVLLLAEFNIKVAVLDVQPLTYEAPKSVYYQKCDIRSPIAVSEAAQAIRSRFNRDPTVLVNNAGVARGKTILDSTEADVRLTFDVNALSHYWLAKDFLPSMIKANHGMIVTVSSLAGYVCTASLVDYAASKAAALAFHEGLTSELITRYEASKVRTVLITQGYTKTPLFQGWSQKNDFGFPALEPDTVAEGIVKQILKGESGQLFLPGMNAFLAPWLRVYPYWLGLPFRNRLEAFMSGGWHGRQVIDPSKGQDKT